eukprot:scaffold147790_cov29-Tisochrysis_lutea.AAC.3
MAPRRLGRDVHGAAASCCPWSLPSLTWCATPPACSLALALSPMQGDDWLQARASPGGCRCD